MKTLAAVSGVLLLILPLSVASDQPEQWQPALDLRYRFEHVDDEGFARNANASTLRVRAGIISPEWSGFSIAGTVHANRRVGPKRFNSTANSRVQYPVVADPDDEGVSEAWVRYRAGEAFQLVAGRQRIVEDNQRFIGNVGFRQLEQTFDAVTLGWRPDDALQVDLRWLDKAHRVFGRSNPNPLLAKANLNAWTATVGYSADSHNLAVYGHRLIFKDRPASHRNIGFRATGSLPGDRGLAYRVELAQQQGLRELSDESSQGYLHLRIQQRLDQWHWFLAHERLGGDGSYAFQTPLATLHAHNGWTDRFLTTPAAGLVDWHAGAGTRFGEWTGLVKLHHFSTDRGSNRLGNEYGLMLARPLPAGLSFEAKAAWFEARGSAPDVGKLWLTLSGSWQ